MTDVPVAFGPWLNVTLDAMKLMAQDSSDAINLGCAITLTPIVEEGTILSYLNTGYYPGTLEWLAGPAGWIPPKEYEHLDYVEYSFAQNIVNLADEDLPTDANTYTVRMELIDTRNGNSLGTLSGNLICSPSVLTVPLLSTIKQLAPPPGDVTVNMLPVDGTIPEGWLIVKSGGSTVGLDPATFKGDDGADGMPGSYLGVKEIAATSYTPLLADEGYLLGMTAATPITVNLNLSAHPVGSRLDFVQVGDGQITFAKGAGVTFVPDVAATRTKGSGVSAVRYSLTTWWLAGDLA